MLARRFNIAHLIGEMMCSDICFLKVYFYPNLDLCEGWYLPNLYLVLDFDIRFSLFLDQVDTRTLWPFHLTIIQKCYLLEYWHVILSQARAVGVLDVHDHKAKLIVALIH